MSEHNKSRTIVISKPVFLFLGLASLWSIWAFQFSNPVELTRDYLHYIFLGITGAIFANSTGAGGGVIFIPVFSSLNFSNEQSISTSFAIQCFGMTAGALTWWFHFKKENQSGLRRELVKLICICSPFSIAGIWTTQVFAIQAPTSLEHGFSLFSIVLGFAILLSSITLTSTTQHRVLNRNEVLQLSLLAYVGGIITAWLSVGVGEVIVIYLLLKKTTPTLAIALGVIVTALTVWSVSPIHLSNQGDAYFNVVLFAGPGAILGGILAKKLALHLPVKGLKIFFAGWIILSGIAMLLI
ncbi:sulfite exporter TauE/SafE family protein [Shewanella psychropiezotolerans]|uniref:Probable membrane transporter protein n=1 Tax=Shewanella psychropiezotolerans TaxID=2593655 RepID=A0ABX5X1V5_9GAMM|nr:MULTISPECIES: sulfite exporter TauE/SafE family protein [Shewanella]MPY21004.1 sulfite exporter TauE/SafE family protein [Shewanella sp. YLB-07]MPY21791.1 sulfite exporter TauE/SafE family protein [Shewanella sp. YLB-07]QDO85316.1 sulfite exporter TauE/SafE family protein [Shewanella psychropiezotolerans]